MRNDYLAISILSTLLNNLILLKHNYLILTMQKTSASFFSNNVFFTFLGFIFFVPFIGNVHLFDWDEINFAEIAREMVVTNEYSQPQINYTLFTEKPPLFFWMQALCMKIFGVNEFAARLPNALLGVLLLPILYATGKRIRDSKFGFIWALVYACSILPHLYFKSGIIDPWFNFFIFLAIYGIATVSTKTSNNNIKWIIFSGIMCGLAILTKGPVAVIIIGLVFAIFLLLNKLKMPISYVHFIVFVVTTIGTTALWLAADYLKNGNKFLYEFTIRQWQLLTTADAGHGGFFFYHFIVLFFGCFPATAFFIYALIKKDNASASFMLHRKWMVIFFWVVLVVFSLVKTKIVHYSSLAYYPISFLAAISIYNIAIKKWIFASCVKLLLIISAIPFVIAPFALVYFGTHKAQLKQLLKKDAFATANVDAAVHWTGWEIVPGIILLIILISTFLFYKKQNTKIVLYTLLGGSAIFVQSFLYFTVGKIEAISQRANIEFWELHKNEDCYITSFQYKTYTHYFYGKIKPQQNKNYTNNDWLLKGNIDKPVYISCKINSYLTLEKEITDAKLEYSKNGFYFYKRMPK